MTYVMEMSTDSDIVNTQLDIAWNPINARYSWAQVSGGNNNIPNGATIVVIAHGNGREIGNAGPSLNINASTFLAVIHSNMAAGAVPAAIYLSTCGTGIAEFAAAVRIAAEQNNIWHNVRLYGHHDPQAGTVQPPSSIVWTQIF
ncbi:MAG TPA: hypothetical protein VGJ20_03830 [Xanthobacteraceae bacterium]